MGDEKPEADEGLSAAPEAPSGSGQEASAQENGTDEQWILRPAEMEGVDLSQDPPDEIIDLTNEHFEDDDGS